MRSNSVAGADGEMPLFRFRQLPDSRLGGLRDLEQPRGIVA